MTLYVPADEKGRKIAGDSLAIMRQSHNLWCYVTVYVIAWTVLTFSANTAIPGGDAIEAFNWAANLDWGTPRSGWLVGLVMYPALIFKSITVRSLYWYFAHFAGVGVGMIGVWKLALRLTHSTQLAWLAVLALHLNVAIGTDAQNQNDNYLLVMLWPWLLYLFIRAGFDDTRFWIPFGLVAGLATMAKYSTLALVWSVFVLTLSTPTLRQGYRRTSFYFGIGLFLLTVVPNLVWLWQHDFVAIHWFADDAKKGFAPSTIVAIVVTFISVLLPFVALWIAGIRFRWPPYQPARTAIVCMLLPMLVILVYLMIYPTSNPSRVAEWLRPFGVLGPPLFVSCICNIPNAMFRKIFVALCGVGCMMFIGYATAKGTNFRNTHFRGSGAAIAGEKAQDLWHYRYSTPLSYVGGSDISNMATFYASDFPALLRAWSDTRQPNVFTLGLCAAEVRRHGALLMGTPGIPCARADFSETLQTWPGMHIDAVEEIPFADSPSDPAQPLCLAFVAPQLEAATPRGCEAAGQQAQTADSGL